MSILKSSYYLFSLAWPMTLLRSLAPTTPLLPYQHTVSDSDLPHIKHLYNYKNTKQFSADLDVLLKHFRPISLADIITAAEKGTELSKGTFLLTFDDGFREVHDIIAPLLEKKGIPSCFFVNPAFIGNKVLFYRCKASLIINELQKNSNNGAYLQLLAGKLGSKKTTTEQIRADLMSIGPANADILDQIATETGFSFEEYLQTTKPFLTEEQLLTLHAKGFAIGAHSIDHPRFQHLSLQDQLDQVRGSCHYVNELLQTRDCCFSFPHSDVGLSQQLFDELCKMNIPYFFGVQNQKSEPGNRMLHRFNAERPGINFTSQIKGILLLQWLRSILNRNKVIRESK